VSGALLSPEWYRIADLRPRLRSHIRLHRHHYRGQPWYVMQDGVSGDYHRFSPVAHRLIGLMDGRRSLREIWDLAAAELGDEAPTQPETLRLLQQLHAADALQADIAPDQEELRDRHKRIRRSRSMGYWKSPLAIRIPLFDPERFLSRTQHWVRPLFGPIGVILWLVTVISGGLVALVHWSELTGDLSAQLLTPQNLFLIWLGYPVIKLLHEFGHAYAVRTWGGEVHQMGIMFLVFMPIPYVDASSATAFPSRGRRALVGLAGILVELFIAALCALVWVNAEPGLLRTLAWNGVMIAGISTLLFNGNPLLRLDAYYVLADLLEIPNLGKRANDYWYYLTQRYLFGVRDVEGPVRARGERFWFLLYAPAALVYRIFIFTVIVLFVATQFFMVGVLLAIWSLFGLLVMPLYRLSRFLFTSPVLSHVRRRAMLISLFLAGLPLALLILLPVPLVTQAEGMVQLPERNMLRAGADGFVERVEARSGQRVGQGERILRLEDPMLAPEVEMLEQELAVAQARYDASRLEDRARALILQDRMAGLSKLIDEKRQRLAQLDLRSRVSGELVLQGDRDLPGRFLRQGDLVGRVITREPAQVIAAVTQAEVDLVLHQTSRVSVRSLDHTPLQADGQLLREMPAATFELPSSMLGQSGGGRLAVDPRGDGTRTLEKVFLFPIQLSGAAFSDRIGQRLLVSFKHPPEPLIYRGLRALRRVFLRHFDV
jgi:putative peptide zinc metalloprotease protein